MHSYSSLMKSVSSAVRLYYLSHFESPPTAFWKYVRANEENSFSEVRSTNMNILTGYKWTYYVDCPEIEKGDSIDFIFDNRLPAGGMIEETSGAKFRVKENGAFAVYMNTLIKINNHFQNASAKEKFLIFSDFDGTLNGDDLALKEFNSFWLANFFFSENHCLIYSTGRSFQSLMETINKNEVFLQGRYIITNNGSEIYFLDHEKGQYVSDDEWNKIVTVAFNKDTVLKYFDRIPWIEENRKTAHDERTLHFLIKASDINKKDEIEILKKCLEKEQGMRIKYSFCRKNNAYFFLDVTGEASGKGNALAYLAGKLKVPIGNTIAFGDGLNDAEMLRSAGKGVIVANAGVEMKEWYLKEGCSAGKISQSQSAFALALLEELRRSLAD